MEALFDTCKQLLADITRCCLASEVYSEECLKMAKYVAKCALVLSEVELRMHEEQSLRGSQSLFLAVDGMVSAFKQVLQLVEQYASAGSGGVWPLEDAVEFQAAALELQNAMIGLSKAKVALPQDVHEDLQHFVRQLGELQFTTSELEEAEGKLEAAQQRTSSRASGEAGPTASHFPLAAIRTSPEPAMSPSLDAELVYVNMETGDTALPPAAPAKGAVPGEALEEPSSPLPDDPFNMDDRLGSSTVEELEGLKLCSAEGASAGALAEESLLEASEDNQGLGEKDQGAPQSEQEALASLRQLAAAARSMDSAGAADDEEEEDGEERENIEALVEDVVAMMEEGDEAQQAQRAQRAQRAHQQQAQQAQQVVAEAGQLPQEGP